MSCPVLRLKDLSLCKALVERGNVTLKSTWSQQAGGPVAAAGLLALLLDHEVHFNLSTSWAWDSKAADGGVGLGDSCRSSRTF